jgi:hypothetical protein
MSETPTKFEEWQAMYDKQMVRCSICGREIPIGLMKVDHYHVEGYDAMPPEEKRKYVRELLCSNCNTGIGMFAKDAATLGNAIDYLKRTYKGESR